MKNKLGQLLIVIFAIFGFTSCGGADTAPPQVTPPTVVHSDTTVKAATMLLTVVSESAGVCKHVDVKVSGEGNSGNSAAVQAFSEAGFVMQASQQFSADMTVMVTVRCIDATNSIYSIGTATLWTAGQPGDFAKVIGRSFLIGGAGNASYAAMEGFLESVGLKFTGSGIAPTTGPAAWVK